ncbi:MAG: hypothetical protein PHN55_14290, partial [Dysgonamonadaceae bacterium]|nr:hypothetical protein [Dysgonamonadaceae bacterium]
MKYKFERSPSLIELKRIATIISWNIWQMDGITFSVPLCDMRCWFEQLTLFDNYGDINNGIEHKYCKIKDWRSRIIIEYRSLVGGGK